MALPPLAPILALRRLLDSIRPATGPSLAEEDWQELGRVAEKVLIAILAGPKLPAETPAVEPAATAQPSSSDIVFETQAEPCKNVPATRTRAAQQTAKEIKVSCKPQPASALPAAFCGNCRMLTIPSERLPGGRVRCGKCRSVFLPSPATPSSSAARATPKKTKRSPGLRLKWKKPAAAVAAAIVLIYFFLPAGLFGKSDRVQVFPVQGKADLDGKPIPEASIFLHPVGVKNPAFPRPRGIVQADGTFVLGTYRKDDGAPPGEYKVSVQLLKQAAGQVLPKNHLPVSYADAETSCLTIHVHQGENQGLLLKLKQ